MSDGMSEAAAGRESLRDKAYEKYGWASLEQLLADAGSFERQIDRLREERDAINKRIEALEAEFAPLRVIITDTLNHCRRDGK